MYSRDYATGFGGDVKFRLTSNFTLDATINPDFGQVEVDPAVLNLSAFETRYDERRPFFVEGAEIFRFGSMLARDAQLLYSRRIGRAPQGSVSSDAAYSETPQIATILGAAVEELEGQVAELRTKANDILMKVSRARKNLSRRNNPR